MKKFLLIFCLVGGLSACHAPDSEGVNSSPPIAAPSPSGIPAAPTPSVRESNSRLSHLNANDRALIKSKFIEAIDSLPQNLEGDSKVLASTALLTNLLADFLHDNQAYTVNEMTDFINLAEQLMDNRNEK